MKLFKQNLSLRFVRDLSLLLTLFIAPNAFAASKLDIGADYRLRGVQISNPNYASDQPGTEITSDSNYYSNRARVYVKARFDPSIEIGTVLQAVGVSGSSGPVLNRYPNENFTPFVEGAYIQANEIFGYPVNLTVGRQPYSWGQGMLISDDGLGFDAIRLDIGPYWGSLRNYFFTAKAKDRVNNNSDSDLHLAGMSYQWGIHNIKFAWILEQDRSGKQYKTLNQSLIATDKIVREFYNINLAGQLEKGAFYNLEYAMQKGSVKIPGRNDITLSGDALMFEGGFDFYHPRLKRMVLAFVFMQGSGDQSSSADEDERFYPNFGHRYDGLEYSGRGEFLAATPYSFYNQEKIRLVTKDANGKVINTYEYDNLFSGLRTFGFRGSVSPWEPFTAGLEFYIITARETPDIRKGAPTTINDNELGRELVITTSYNYAKRILFSLRWGKVFPSVNLNNVGSSRIMFEASAKF